MLGDDEWAQVACDIMHRTGLAPYGQDDDAVRWVAVRHAADHIHIVAMLARQDGTAPACGTTITGSARHAGPSKTASACGAPPPATAPPPPVRPARSREDPPPRLARSRPGSPSGGRSAPRPPPRPASRSSSPASTPPACSVRKRFSTRNPGEVTGYAVALPADTTEPAGRSGTAAGSSPRT